MFSLDNMMNKLFRKTMGIILIIIGVFGLFLPFIQGILLIIAGLLLFDEEKYGKLIKDIKKRYVK
jgi:hypothetical protein